MINGVKQKCKICKVVKSVNDFYYNRTTSFREKTCKSCRLKRQKYSRKLPVFKIKSKSKWNMYKLVDDKTFDYNCTMITSFYNVIKHPHDVQLFGGK